MKLVTTSVVVVAALFSAGFTATGKDTVLDVVSEYLGQPPSNCQLPVLIEPKITATAQIADGVLTFYRAVNCAGALNFIVGTPNSAQNTTPIVMALPQTSNAGAKEVFGLAGDPALGYGRKFMQAGFVVVSPEVWINGDGSDASADWNTANFYKLFPRWSALGRMLEDNRSVLDFMARSRPNASCIAAVGHSLGGHNAIFLSAFDKRVDVTVSNAGFEPIATDTDAERWSRSSWFIYAPKLREVVTAPAPRKVPFDFSDILSSIAPRAVMVIQEQQDPNWTHIERLPGSLQDIENGYSDLHVPNRFRLEMFPGGHSFPDAEQTRAVEFVKGQCAR